MTKQARTKVSVPSAPAQKEWTLLSRPFMDATQIEQADGRISAVRHVDFMPPTRSFGEISGRNPMPLIVQPKLELGPADDAYEREADTVAAQVVPRLSGTASELPPPLPSIQRLATVGGTAEVSPEIEAGIEESRRGGQPLATSIRGSMERAFGADFNGVRVHADAQSDRLNQSLQASALTSRQDIFFRRGAYLPETNRGRKLLAHELTHVVQQSASRPVRSDGRLSVHGKHAFGSSLLQMSTNDFITTTRKKKGATTIGASGYVFLNTPATFQDHHLASTDNEARDASELRKTADKQVTWNTVIMDDLEDIQTKVLAANWEDADLNVDTGQWTVPITCRHKVFSYASSGTTSAVSNPNAPTVQGEVWIKVWMSPRNADRKTIRLAGIAG